MIISLHSDALTLRLSAFSDAEAAFVATLPGAYVAERGGYGYARLCQLRRLLDAFPGAMVRDKATVIEARLEQWARWVEAMNTFDIWFAYAHDAQTVVAMGQNVSPVFQAWVGQHSAQIAQWLHVQRFPVQYAPPPAPTPVSSSPQDAQIWDAIQGGRRAKERGAETINRVKANRRTAKKVQMELELS